MKLNLRIYIQLKGYKNSHLPWEDLPELFQSPYELQLWVSRKNTNGDSGKDAKGKKDKVASLKCIWHEISYFLKWKNLLSCSITYFSVSCFYGLFLRYFNLFDM
jgi:hypothetical protein